MQQPFHHQVGVAQELQLLCSAGPSLLSRCLVLVLPRFLLLLMVRATRLVPLLEEQWGKACLEIMLMRGPMLLPLLLLLFLPVLEEREKVCLEIITIMRSTLLPLSLPVLEEEQENPCLEIIIIIITMMLGQMLLPLLLQLFLPVWGGHQCSANQPTLQRLPLAVAVFLAHQKVYSPDLGLNLGLLIR